jgi:hypothetical protein
LAKRRIHDRFADFGLLALNHNSSEPNENRSYFIVVSPLQPCVGPLGYLDTRIGSFGLIGGGRLAGRNVVWSALSDVTRCLGRIECAVGPVLFDAFDPVVPQKKFGA